MRLAGLVLLTMVVWTEPSLASMRTAKLRVWFPTDGDTWEKIAQGPCAASIARFHAGDRSLSPAPCAAALDCILDNTSESGKSNLGNAQVLLGLTPTILSLFGSNVAELAVLGWRRPWLTLLLSLGAPAFQMQSFFTVLEATPILGQRIMIENQPRPILVTEYYHWLKNVQKQGPGGVVLAKLCYIAPYILALASIANTVATSLYLDLRAVVGFRCGAIYMPLAWGLIGIFPATLAMLAAWRQYGIHKPSLWPWKRNGEAARDDGVAPQSWSVWATKSMYGQHRRRGQWLSDVIFSAAALAAILQLIYGTSMLSAMTPVFFWDALPIITRYAASSIVCRAVVLVELELMRLELQDDGLGEGAQQQDTGDETRQQTEILLPVETSMQMPQSSWIFGQSQRRAHQTF